MLGYAEIHNAPLPQLLRWWDGVDPPLADFEDGFFDEVAYALTKHRPEGITVLKRYLNSDDSKRRSAALWFLAYPDVADEEVFAALMQAFNNGSRDFKFTALWGFIHLDYFILPRHQIETLMEDEDEQMAALAMVYHSRAWPVEAVKTLGNGLRSPNARKREFACDEVGDRRIGELSEQMRLLLNDPDTQVAEAARGNLAPFSDSS